MIINEDTISRKLSSNISLRNSSAAPIQIIQKNCSLKINWRHFTFYIPNISFRRLAFKKVEWSSMQGDQLNMAMSSWYLVKKDLSYVCYSTCVHLISLFLQAIRKTRPCLTGHPVHCMHLIFILSRQTYLHLIVSRGSHRKWK